MAFLLGGGGWNKEKGILILTPPITMMEVFKEIFLKTWSTGTRLAPRVT